MSISMHRSIKQLTALCLSVSLLAPAVLAKGKGPWEEHIESGRNALQAGDYESADRLLKEAMEDTRKFKDDDVRLGTTYYLIGQLNVRQQNYSLAKEYYQRALAVQQKLLGAESLEAADSLYGISLCEQQLGDHLAAEIFLKRVHEIWRKKLSANDQRLISILPSMAAYAAMKNDLSAAERHYRQLVDIAQAGGDQEQLGSYLNLLSTTLGNEGKYTEAKDFATRAVDILKKSSDSSIAIDSAQDNLRIVERKVSGTVSGANTASDTTSEAGKIAAEQANLKAEQERLAAEAARKAEAARIAAEKARQVELSRIAAEKARADAEAQIAAEKARKAEQAKIAAAEAKAEEERKLAELRAKAAEQAKAEAEKAKIAAEQARRQADELPQTRVQVAHDKQPAGSDKFDDAAPKPWKTDRAIKKPGQDKSQQWGKVRYLADGKLISAEEYKALLLANEAYEAMRQEKYRMAADILNKALEICPELPTAHTNLGLALARLGKPDDAIEHLRIAIAIDPSRSAPWVNLASSFQTTGRLRDCVETYKEYLRRFPNDTLAEKARDLVKHLQTEADEQDAIEKLVASSKDASNDYFPFTTAGGTVKWTDDKLPLKIHIASGSRVPGYKSEFQGIMTDSFKTWGTASQDKIKFEFVNKPENANIECIWTNDYAQVNSPSEGGEAQVSWSSKGIERVKIVILTVDPTPDSPLTQNQVQAVCLHEIGHSLGLIGHSPKPSDIMFCTMPSADAKVAISPRDVSTLRHLYAPDVHIALTPRVKHYDANDKNSINNEGVELMSTHAYAKAIEKFEAALKLDPDYDLAKENLSRAYNNYALDLAAKGNAQDAESLMQKAVKLQASIKNAALKLMTFNNYAQILRKMRRENEAAKIEAEAKTIQSKVTN